MFGAKMCLPPGLCPGPRRLPAPPAGKLANVGSHHHRELRAPGPRYPTWANVGVRVYVRMHVCMWLPPAFASFGNMLMYQIAASKVCPSIVCNVICCLFVIPDDMIRG